MKLLKHENKPQLDFDHTTVPSRLSETPDKWNFRLVKPISPVPWICINKPLLFYSDKWNPR